MMKVKTKRTGFTLIELLVVIAIIAILAAVLFPVFARARAKAQEASCLSNVKEIALAILMYTEDYDAFFPLTYYTPPRTYWPLTIFPYLGQGAISTTNYGIFGCPGMRWDHNWYSGAYSQYGINYQLSQRFFPTIARDVAVKYPTSTVLIGESIYYHSNGKTYGWYRVTSPTGSTRFDHNDRGNYAFCDGHAKGFTKQQLIGGVAATEIFYDWR